MTAPAADGDFRIERDTMGEVRVPAGALYQAQTQRAVENFPISGIPIDPALIAALGLIKGAAAQVNAELGVLDPERAEAIEKAAAAVAAGEHDGEFPIDVFQTGSGTSSNMNANEVIASLAGQLLGQTVHPNDARERLPVQQRRLPQCHPHRGDAEPAELPCAGAPPPGTGPRRRRPRSSPRWSRAAGRT